MSRVLPTSGAAAGSITLDAGAHETIFEIPVKYMNLSKSTLCFDMAVAGPAANAPYLQVDGLTPISQLQFYNAGGIMLCDLSDVDVYTRVVTKPETKLEEFLNYPKFKELDNTTGTVYPSSRLLGRCNATTLAVRPDGTNHDLDYTECAYVCGGEATGGFTIQCKIPLGQIKNTIFDIDKDIYFNEIMQLRIVWSTKARVGWEGTSETDPSDGAAALSSALTLSNIELFLAIEQNQGVINTIAALVSSGQYSLIVPWTRTNKTAYTGGAQNVINRYDRSHGIRLSKIYHTVYNASAGKNLVHNNSNVSAAVTSNFYTMLDSERLQEFNVDCSKAQDYMLLQERIAGSVIQDPNMYSYNWFWLDDFSDYLSPSDLPIYPPENNLLRGLSLEEQRKWEFVATMATTGDQLTHYTFAVFQRILSVSSSGITFG